MLSRVSGVAELTFTTSPGVSDIRLWRWPLPRLQRRGLSSQLNAGSTNLHLVYLHAGNRVQRLRDSADARAAMHVVNSQDYFWHGIYPHPLYLLLVGELLCFTQAGRVAKGRNL